MPPAVPAQDIRYSDFLDELDTGRVDSVILQGQLIQGTRKDKTQFRAYNPETDNSALIGVAAEGRRGHRRPRAQAAAVS